MFEELGRVERVRRNHPPGQHGQQQPRMHGVLCGSRQVGNPRQYRHTLAAVPDVHLQRLRDVVEGIDVCVYLAVVPEGGEPREDRFLQVPTVTEDQRRVGFQRVVGVVVQQRRRTSVLEVGVDVGETHIDDLAPVDGCQTDGEGSRAGGRVVHELIDVVIELLCGFVLLRQEVSFRTE